MYTLVRGLIDNVLMGPALSGITTTLLVIGIALTAAAIVTGGDMDDVEE